MTYHPEKSILRLDGNEISLSSTENIILKMLSVNMNTPIKREKLIELQPGYISERSIDVTINRIRKKLGENNKYLQTIRHIGYMLSN